VAEDEIPLANRTDYFRDLVHGRMHGLWPTLQRGGLWVASVPYGWATRFRNCLYDGGWKSSRRVPVPVVSVGNLTLGGTGKTPCVGYITDFYRRHGRRVAILSRGYGSQRAPNDEALLLRENLPDVLHFQGVDRVALAWEAVKTAASEVLVLDDGFQHRRLARDLDIVLIDATQPWESDYLFPRGLLRETHRSLSRAGVVILTRCDQASENKRGRLREAIAQLTPSASVVETIHRPLDLMNSRRQTMSLAALVSRKVAAFCGIGNPHAFRTTLDGLGLHVVAFRTFPDHHAYTAADVADLTDWAKRQSPEAVAITTQKDLVKVRSFNLGDSNLWSLRVRLHLEVGGEALHQRLLNVFPSQR
jgi:tetraacyldisaccharide 4'-kinase